MIRAKIKSLIILVLALTSIFLWAINAFLIDEVNQQKIKHEFTKASTISRINLLIINSQISERQGLSWLLQQLDNESQIIFWQLFNEKNKRLSQKLVGEPVGIIQDLYLYADEDRKKLMTLRVYFNDPQYYISIWNAHYLLMASLFVFGLFALFYILFKWVFQLENYARYLLSDTNHFTKTKFEQLANPINQIINQLIFSNSVLNKDKVELTEQIRKISYVDEVTGLGNQLFFKAEFQVRLYNHEEDESGLFMIISFTDKDVLEKNVISDDMLLSIANLLRRFSKSISKSLVARLRDKDFALLLPNQSRDQTDDICKTLITQLDKSLFDTKLIQEDFIGIGISAYKQGFDYYKIVAEADMALRNSQLQGGNSWYMYGEPLANNQVRGHLRWRNFLNQVLDKRQLQLFGQEIHFFNHYSGSHQEVLIRIEDGKDLLTADTFLPMAHECGLATEFDRQIVDGVIKHCLYTSSTTSFHIYSINLFISSLLDEGFVSWLISKLSSYPKLSRQIVFEIKESHINQNLANLDDIMSTITKLGSSWCVDHFGSPDEDLAFLDILPIKSVKIDRRIVFDIHKNKPQQLLLKSMIINLKSKHIGIFAEGVEKIEDAEYLEEVGIDGAQGFFFSEPKRVKSMEKHLKVI